MFLGIKNVTEDGRLDLTDIRHIAEEDFGRWTKRVEPRPGDLVFTYEATLNRYALIPQGFRGCLGRRMALIRPDTRKVNSKYLYYYFFTPEWRAVVKANMLSGSTVDRLPLTHFPTFPVRLLDRREQDRAVDVLSAYDDLIENCERRIRVIDEMARALYREWFVGSGARMMVRELMDQRVLEVNDGYRAKNAELGTSGLPFARAGNINSGFRFDDADRFPEGNLAKVGTKVSRPGDIVFTSKGTVGRFARVRDTTEQFVYSPQLCYWRVTDTSQLSRSYLYRWMQSREFLDQVDMVKGSTDMADYVSLTNQRRMLVRLPSRDVMLKADSVLEPLDSQMAVLESQATTLRRTRDLLLPRLLSGKIPLDVDAAV